MALPGAMIARRFNHKTGVLVASGIYAIRRKHEIAIF